jgi:hypothetical protein
VTAILVGSLSVLVFNCELQELLVVVPLVGCVYVQLLSNACPLVMLGLRALHVVVDNMLELVFLESGLVLRQLGSLIGHFDILERSLAIQFSQVSIFCSFIRICCVRILGRVLCDVPLVGVFGYLAMEGWRESTLA